MDWNGEWLAQQTESKERIHPLCCWKGTQFLKARDFSQPWPRAGRTHTLKLLSRVCELSARSEKDQGKKELGFCLKGLRLSSARSCTCRVNWKREERTPKSRRVFPAARKAIKSAGGKKIPYQDSAGYMQFSFSLKKGNLTWKCQRKWGHVRKNSLFHGIKRLKLCKKEMLLSAFQGWICTIQNALSVKQGLAHILWRMWIKTNVNTLLCEIWFLHISIWIVLSPLCVTLRKFPFLCSALGETSRNLGSRESQKPLKIQTTPTKPVPSKSLPRKP